MPETIINEKVMEMIEAALGEDPNISNAALRERAEEIDDSIRSLDARQFNARYPLQVKRKIGPSKPRKPYKPRAPRKPAAAAAADVAPSAAPASPRPAAAAAAPRSGGGEGRGQVRQTLLEFARELVAADRVGVIDVVGRIDDYVDRIVAQAGA